MDDNEVYLTVIVLNLTFRHKLFSDLDHHSTTLNQDIVNGFEGNYEVMDVDGHSSEGIIVHYND